MSLLTLRPPRQDRQIGSPSCIDLCLARLFLSIHVYICVPLQKGKRRLSCENSIQFYEDLSADHSKYSRGPAKKAGGVEPEPGPHGVGLMLPSTQETRHAARAGMSHSCTPARPWTLGPTQPSSCFSSVFPSVSVTQFPCL